MYAPSFEFQKVLKPNGAARNTLKLYFKVTIAAANALAQTSSNIREGYFVFDFVL